MSCGRLCVRTTVIARPSETVREAARRMADERVGTLVVLGEDDRLAGILTDRDVAVRCVGAGLDPDAARVGELMSAPVHSVREATSLEDGLATMVGARVRRLPVLDERDALVGILALDDLLELLAEESAAIGRLLRRARSEGPAQPR